MKKLLGIVAVGAIAFGAVSAAAASLTVNQANIPVQGNDNSVASACSDSIDISYTVDASGGNVTAITATTATNGDGCNGLDAAFAAESAKTLDGTNAAGKAMADDTGSGACATANYTAGVAATSKASWVCTFAAGQPTSAFDPGEISVSLY